MRVAGGCGALPPSPAAAVGIRRHITHRTRPSSDCTLYFLTPRCELAAEQPKMLRREPVPAERGAGGTAVEGAAATRVGYRAAARSCIRPSSVARQRMAGAEWRPDRSSC